MSHVSHKSQILNKHSASSFLQRALQANGLFSATSGVVMLAMAGSIAAIIGVNAPGVIRFIGANLIGFAIALIWVARQHPINYKLVQTAIILDLLWVISSVVLLSWRSLSLTTSGQWIIALIAMVVGMFTIAQYYGVRQMHQQG